MKQGIFVKEYKERSTEDELLDAHLPSHKDMFDLNNIKPKRQTNFERIEPRHSKPLQAQIDQPAILEESGLLENKITHESVDDLHFTAQFENPISSNKSINSYLQNSNKNMIHELNDFESQLRLSGIYQNNDIISFRQAMYGENSVKIRFGDRKSNQEQIMETDPERQASSPGFLGKGSYVLGISPKHNNTTKHATSSIKTPVIVEKFETMSSSSKKQGGNFKVNQDDIPQDAVGPKVISFETSQSEVPEPQTLRISNLVSFNQQPSNLHDFYNIIKPKDVIQSNKKQLKNSRGNNITSSKTSARNSPLSNKALRSTSQSRAGTGNKSIKKDQTTSTLKKSASKPINADIRQKPVSSPKIFTKSVSAQKKQNLRYQSPKYQSLENPIMIFSNSKNQSKTALKQNSRYSTRGSRPAGKIISQYHEFNSSKDEENSQRFTNQSPQNSNFEQNRSLHYFQETETPLSMNISQSMIFSLANFNGKIIETNNSNQNQRSNYMNIKDQIFSSNPNIKGIVDAHKNNVTKMVDDIIGPKKQMSSQQKLVIKSQRQSSEFSSSPISKSNLILEDYKDNFNSVQQQQICIIPNSSRSTLSKLSKKSYQTTKQPTNIQKYSKINLQQQPTNKIKIQKNRDTTPRVSQQRSRKNQDLQSSSASFMMKSRSQERLSGIKKDKTSNTKIQSYQEMSPKTKAMNTSSSNVKQVLKKMTPKIESQDSIIEFQVLQTTTNNDITQQVKSPVQQHQKRIQTKGKQEPHLELKHKKVQQIGQGHIKLYKNTNQEAVRGNSKSPLTQRKSPQLVRDFSNLSSKKPFITNEQNESILDISNDRSIAIDGQQKSSIMDISDISVIVVNSTKQSNYMSKQNTPLRTKAYNFEQQSNTQSKTNRNYSQKKSTALYNNFQNKDLDHVLMKQKKEQIKNDDKVKCIKVEDINIETKFKPVLQSQINQLKSQKQTPRKITPMISSSTSKIRNQLQKPQS